MKTSVFFIKILNSKFFLFALLSLILFSCKSGETIADKGIIQKRKYQKGYHVNVKSPFDVKNSSVQNEKISDDAFTASIKASLATNTVEPILAKPIAQESKIKTDNILFEGTKKTTSDNFVADNIPEATASLGNVDALNSEKSAYTTKKPSQNQPQDYYSARKLSTVALLSFIFGVLSFFILGIPFGIAAVVLGIIGIVQVEKNRDIYKGQGFAIAGLILGLIAVVIVLAYLATLA